MNKFKVFNNKTVLITGNSGFKGSWLSAWLVQLGANVVGLSSDIPSSESHFSALKAAHHTFVNHLIIMISNIT